MKPILRVASMLMLAGAAYAGDPDLALERRLAAHGVQINLESLTNALRSSSSDEIREMIADYLSMRPDPRAWDVLLQVARNDPFEMVRARAASALLAIDCKRARGVAVGVLDASDSAAAMVVAHGMSRCGQDEGLSTYEAVLNKTGESVGRYAAAVGCQVYLLTGSVEVRSQAASCLGRALNDGDKTIRSVAVRSFVLAVETYGIVDPPVLEALEEISRSSSDEAERQSAARALRSARVRDTQSKKTEEQ